jgi:hypothetical protein
MTLRDALAQLKGVNVRADRPTYYEDRVAFAAIVAAARRVAEAPEVWWCETHFSLADNLADPEECEGMVLADGNLYTPCRMVRKLLVDPPKENP